jgi:hypothetical protein
MRGSATGGRSCVARWQDECYRGTIAGCSRHAGLELLDNLAHRARVHRYTIRQTEMTYGKETKQPSKPAAEADEAEYKPTPAETDALKAYFAAKDTLAPRIKVTSKRVAPDHVSLGVAQIAIMKSIGTTDTDFYSGLMLQLINVGSPGKEPDEAGTNFMLSIVKGIKPRDQIEAMLAAQMAAVHVASMTFARRLAHVDNIPQQDSAERAFNKLTRTFAAQVSALKDYRSKGEQKMTVQHVHVAEGGQAIVGNVNAPAEGGGAREKSGEQSHALGYAPGITLPREIEAERVAVPSAGRERG